MPIALIIDDDFQLRHMVSAMLQQQGFDTVDAASVDEGIRKARSSRPDVILCDKSLGEGDGFTILEALRADEELNTIPFIMMTGQHDTLRPSMNRGADDFLLKPFTRASLVTSVQTQLRKHQQRAAKLAESRARLLAVLETSPDFVATLRGDGTFMEINPAGLAMLGIPEGSSAPFPTLVEVRPDSHNTTTTQEILEAARKRGFWRGESLFRRLDGHILSVSQIIVSHRAPDGCTDFFSTNAHEIVDAKARQSASQLVHRALEWSSNGVAILDAATSACAIIYSNPAFDRSFGYPVGELQRQSRPFLEILKADPASIIALEGALSQGVEKRAIFQLEARPGTSSWSEIGLSPVRDAQGEVTHFVAVQYDVTRQKEAERERQLMEVQLREAQKLEAIGQLAAGIAHEINTPTQFIGDNAHFLKTAFADLGPILKGFRLLLERARQGPVEAALLDQLEATVRDADLDYLTREIPLAIQQSQEGVERVTNIVRAMKEFSHPGSSEKVPIDLNRAIEATQTIARNAWKHIADLELHLDPSLPPVPCFPAELNQVLLNLLVNATHAVEEAIESGQTTKGRIVISSALRDRQVEVRVSDNGAGIPDHVRHRIFEPHFTTKPIGKGTGQGLALARTVVHDKHGGTIRFESTVGVGTTFIIELPLSSPKRGKED
ncbi:MAG TPA: ATP-binding protein [Candidatus Limnocylindria bacterium]|jgi:PAS domain S-box-containing protein|nr:ATP-binding protein [Candidatus Limnocylindria bacterium]